MPYSTSVSASSSASLASPAGLAVAAVVVGPTVVLPPAPAVGRGVVTKLTPLPQAFGTAAAAAAAGAAVGVAAAAGRRGAGSAGKSSLTFGFLVVSVMVAYDSKSCSGSRGLGPNVGTVGVRMVVVVPSGLSWVGGLAVVVVVVVVDVVGVTVVVDVALAPTTAGLAVELGTIRAAIILLPATVAVVGVVGVGGCGVVTATSAAALSLLLNRLRMPPKNVDFLVVGTGAGVVVAARTSFSAMSAFV